MSLESLDITSFDVYGGKGYPWEAWDRLRDEAPVYWYTRPDMVPFWAVTRYADVHFVGSNDKLFINGGPRLRLASAAEDERMAESRKLRAQKPGWDIDEPPDFIFMDRPRHTKFRSLTNRRFTPKAMRKIEDHLAQYARRFTNEFIEVLERDGQADLVDDYAVKLPLATICDMMGLPIDDWAVVHKYTEAMFENPANEQWALPGESFTDQRRRMADEFRGYLNRLVDARRATPQDDLASSVANGEIDGCPLTAQQLNGYMFVLIAAGNETTRNATTRGIAALLKHPDQLQRLIDDPSLVDSAVEEILRWTSPVIQFARTATADVELGGQHIKAGDTVGIFYPSANRDERAFPNPYTFDVGRTPNHHVAFGHGVHFCLGANLARWELRAMLHAVLPLLPRLELVGEPDRLPHLHLGAWRHQPVRLIS